jgi:Flp pilus assembly CpaE family ATPase
VELLYSVEADFSPGLIHSCLLTHPSGIEILTFPPTIDPALSLSREQVAPLIKMLASTFTFTLLDFPQLLDPTFASALPLFDKFLLLLSADMPAIQSTAVALQGLVREGVPTDKINLVVNHLTPYNTVPVNTIQKVLKRQITTVVPFEPDLVKAANSGQPLLLSHPESPASAAIGQLAETIFT